MRIEQGVKVLGVSHLPPLNQDLFDFQINLTHLCERSKNWHKEREYLQDKYVDGVYFVLVGQWRV